MVRRIPSLLILATAAIVMSMPTDARAQRAQGRAVVRGAAVARPAVYRPYYYRPYHYRPYYYPGYYYRPYYYPYYYPAYYSPYSWSIGVGFSWGYPWYGSYYQPYPYPYPPYYPHYRDYEEASARLEVTPRDAQVFVDGYYVGVVDDFDGSLQRLHLRSGEHTIQIYKEGYRTISERVTFARGETYRVKFALEPLAAGDPQPSRPAPDPNTPVQEPQPSRRPPDSPRGEIRGEGGAIAIRVQPEGAVVLIDGERWDTPAGREPLVINLTDGPHRIEVQKEGYRGYSVEIRIRRGETVPLNVSLKSGGF